MIQHEIVQFTWIAQNDIIFSSSSTNVKKMQDKIIFLAWEWDLRRLMVNSYIFVIQLQNLIICFKQQQIESFVLILELFDGLNSSFESLYAIDDSLGDLRSNMFSGFRFLRLFQDVVSILVSTSYTL